MPRHLGRFVVNVDLDLSRTGDSHKQKYNRNGVVDTVQRPFKRNLQIVECVSIKVTF